MRVGCPCHGAAPARLHAPTTPPHLVHGVKQHGRRLVQRQHDRVAARRDGAQRAQKVERGEGVEARRGLVQHEHLWGGRGEGQRRGVSSRRLVSQTADHDHGPRPRAMPGLHSRPAPPAPCAIAAPPSPPRLQAHLGVGHELHADRDAPPLAAADARRCARARPHGVAAHVVDLELGHDLVHARVHRRWRQGGRQPQRGRVEQALLNSERPQQQVVLRHERRDARERVRADGRAVEAHAAADLPRRVRRERARERRQQRRLAAARGAEHAGHLARAHRARDAVQDRLPLGAGGPGRSLAAGVAGALVLAHADHQLLRVAAGRGRAAGRWRGAGAGAAAAAGPQLGKRGGRGAGERHARDAGLDNQVGPAELLHRVAHRRQRQHRHDRGLAAAAAAEARAAADAAGAPAARRLARLGHGAGARRGRERAAVRGAVRVRARLLRARRVGGRASRGAPTGLAAGRLAAVTRGVAGRPQVGQHRRHHDAARQHAGAKQRGRDGGDDGRDPVPVGGARAAVADEDRALGVDALGGLAGGLELNVEGADLGGGRAAGRVGGWWGG
jgi:hypothetical protein